MSIERKSGVIRFWNEAKGYGFIQLDDAREIFMHHSQWAEQNEPAKNDRVTFIEDIGKDRRPYARQVIYAIIIAALVLLPLSARAQFNSNELVSFSNISASTATFTLRGGQYAVTAHAGSWSAGSLTLERQAVDGSTFVPCLTAFSADGYATVFLPSGTYKFVVATSTGVYVDITSIWNPH